MIDIEEIKNLLPHRFPFLLVDRVEEIDNHKYIKAYKNVTNNEPFFTGHFPNKLVMPGVLILEALAQASGILGFISMNKTPQEGSMYYFVGSDKLRFKNPVIPGDKLTLESKKISEKAGIWKFDCKATVEEKLICSAIVLCADRPK
tara:strand:- start:1962 stop:2399 length:438 start_codon:yes stop_codon:yes gene_type:complete